VFSEKHWKKEVRDILKKYQWEVVSAIKKDGYGGMEENKWTFAGAFLYSLTVITTIGEFLLVSIRDVRIKIFKRRIELTRTSFLCSNPN